MNNIDTEKFRKGEELPLIEEFYSIQGEGYNMGKAAYFIRVGGCDIGCKWCDSKVSWDPDFHNITFVKDIVKNANKYPAKAVVVTGGEPLLYNLLPLCEQLKAHNIKTFIETSGAYNVSGIWDWFCLSPKQQNPPTEDAYKIADELKVIIYNDSDFEWAEEAAKNVNKNCKLLLQPEWSRYKENIEKIVNYVKDNPKWNISLQAHKFMKIP